MNKTEKRLYTVFGLTFAEQPRALLLRGSFLESSALRFRRCRKVANFCGEKVMSGLGFLWANKGAGFAPVRRKEGAGGTLRPEAAWGDTAAGWMAGPVEVEGPKRKAVDPTAAAGWAGMAKLNSFLKG